MSASAQVEPPTPHAASTANGSTLRPRPRAISNARRSFREQLAAASSDDDEQKPPANKSTRPPPGGTALFQRSPSSVAPVIRERGVESGLQGDAIYAAAMPRWRYAIRQLLVAQLRRESEWMARMQRRLRTPLLDSFFYHTGLFGTHTFFMAALPVLFWFGDHDAGRGLLYVTSMGIYVSSYAKDLACTPRPFSPPVIRLSMSTHGQEYGFPSSHSTNSVSIALFFDAWLAMNAERGTVAVLATKAVLLFYALSIILGRMYCGMHSIADCVAGTVMGWACWYAWQVAERPVTAWVSTGHWSVPVLSTVVCLLLVNKHPEPVDDCPCFEDAIAVLACLLGSFVVHWTHEKGWTTLPAGAPTGAAPLGASGPLAAIPLWTLWIILKLAVGIAIIVGWRIVAKYICRLVLPPIFRWTSSALDFELPTRRHYRAATSYGAVPDSHHLGTMPSFIDLPGRAVAPSETSSPIDSPQLGGAVAGSRPIVNRRRSPKPRKEHYDVDVLTKVIVYCGIAMLAIAFCPWVHDAMERRLLW